MKNINNLVNYFIIILYMSSHSRKRKLDTSEPSSLSPNNSKSRKRKLDTPPKTTSLSPNKIKKLLPK